MSVDTELDELIIGLFNGGYGTERQDVRKEITGIPLAVIDMTLSIHKGNRSISK